MFQVGLGKNDVGWRGSFYWQEPYSSLKRALHIQGGEEGLRTSSGMEVCVVT